MIPCTVFHRWLPRVVFVLIGLLALAPQRNAEAQSDSVDTAFQGLQQRLVQDGFDSDRIGRIYANADVRFDAEGVAWFFTYRESKLNYDQFLSHASLRKARSYQERHAAALREAESIYGVDRNVITAILLVETKLGTYLGNRAILNTLSTMASLSDPQVREQLWESMEGKKRISRKRFEEKADGKSRWAYGELKAFLEYAELENIDPLQTVGSLAGAMGISQFMPSNALKLAEDGNGDGRVDLFDHADAIASVANYLRHHGWRPGIGRDRAFKILLRYNYSKYYANTVLDIAERLKG
jgi:membrane-bound lytic murein transglycosylase B